VELAGVLACAISAGLPIQADERFGALSACRRLLPTPARQSGECFQSPFAASPFSRCATFAAAAAENECRGPADAALWNGLGAVNP